MSRDMPDRRRGDRRPSHRRSESMSYTIIDVDTHVTETPELWTSRAPASMRDRVPRVETAPDGSLRWVLGAGQSLASVGMTATAGAGSFKHPPKTYEEMHP